MVKPLAALESFVQPGVRARGANYFAQRRVSIDSIGDEVHAHVFGSRRYSVVLALDDPRRVDAACECEYFDSELSICKHIWATLLALAERQPQRLQHVRRLVADDLLLDVLDEDAFDELEQIVGRGRVLHYQPRPSWKDFFSSLQSRLAWEMPPAAQQQEPPAELLYVLNLEYARRSAVVIDIYGRYRKRDGSLGAAKKIRIAPATISRLAEADQELVALLYVPHETFSNVEKPKFRILLPRLAATGRLHFLLAGGRGAKGDLAGPLELDDRSWEFRVIVDRVASNYVIRGRFVAEGEELAIDDVTAVVAGEWFIHGSRIGSFSGGASAAWLEALATFGEVKVPARAEHELAAALAASPRTPLIAPAELSIVDIEPKPKLTLMREYGESWAASLRILYGDQEIDPGDRDAAKKKNRYVRRRPDLEAAFAVRLTALGARGYGSDFHVPDRVVMSFVSALIAEDWTIELGSEPLLSGGDLELEISSGIDWFDLEGGVSFGDKRVGLPQLLESLERSDPFVKLEGGGFAVVDPKWKERLSGAAAADRQASGALRFRKSQVTLVDALFAARGDVKTDRDFERLRESLQRADSLAPHQEPAGFGTELRPYQRTGLGWLHFLRDVGFGGCLADDMGLGKTVQALALLEELRAQGIGRPSLIVAPRSLIFNWKAEAARFAPTLRVLDHHGIDRVKGSEHFAEYDLILTTYATLQRDLPHLAAAELEYVILDEAQAIKNATSQSAKAVKSLRPRHRLALSGTPIENHLGELWSLFDFLNPGMLGTARTFSRAFGGKSAPLEQREKLARIVKPFVLRRTKQNVALDLPEKDEQTLWVELPEEQRREYDELREHYRGLLLKRVERDGLQKSKMYVLEALLRLRQAALHPALIDPKRGEEGSAKVDALEAELAVLAASDHKALVFSQFTSMLDVLEPRLDKLKIGFVRLDGRSRRREELVETFQNDPETRVFLISLKAGGVGLNLTAADYVYLLDPWWNPAVEAQAVDRAYRIGQLRRVTATRIVASDTVEEKILQLQESKRALAESIIQADDALIRTLDLADLEMLLS